jgi:hypothetical protein
MCSVKCDIPVRCLQARWPVTRPGWPGLEAVSFTGNPVWVRLYYPGYGCTTQGTAVLPTTRTRRRSCQPVNSEVVKDDVDAPEDRRVPTREPLRSIVGFPPVTTVLQTEFTGNPVWIPTPVLYQRRGDIHQGCESSVATYASPLRVVLGRVSTATVSFRLLLSRTGELPTVSSETRCGAVSLGRSLIPVLTRFVRRWGTPSGRCLVSRQNRQWRPRSMIQLSKISQNSPVQLHCATNTR